MKTSRVTRIVKLLTVMQSGSSYGPDDLVDVLGISRRTLFRDLNELKEVGVPFKFDKSGNKYEVDPEFFLPPIDLNLQEALSLLILVQKHAKNVQHPFRTSTMLAALKVENNLSTKIKNYCNLAMQNISTRLSADLNKNLDGKFAALQNAIMRRQIVDIKYDSIFEGKIIESNIHPYHMLFNRRSWYIVGYSSLHKSVRTFKINRMLKIGQLGKCYSDDREFDIDDYLARAWSMIPEGKLYSVRLRFMPKVARNVSEVLWHPTQKTRFEDDGAVVMNFRVNGLNEISWWIMGYGDQVRVIRPAKLREMIIEKAERMIEVNQELGDET